MALTKIGSIGINTGIAFAGVTTIVTLNGSDAVLSVGGTVNFVSDVSIGGTVSIAGTLTYEDVTNVDAVGLITARDGINVGSGITLSVDGDIFATGITTISENLKVGTGVTLSPDGDGFFTGVVTATTFKGDGSQLSNVTSTTINSNADNRLITGSGTANTLEGESSLTYSSTGDLTQTVTVDGKGIVLSAGDVKPMITGNSNRSAQGNTILGVSGKWNDTEVARIAVEAGADTTNKDDGSLNFSTTESGGSLTKRMVIASNGNVSVGNNPTVSSDTIFHVEKSGETNVQFEGDTSTLGARLTLKNNNTGASAMNQIDFADAGGQSTSSIKGFNTDQTNNYGYLTFNTRSASGTPPQERMRIATNGNVTMDDQACMVFTNAIDVNNPSQDTPLQFSGLDVSKGGMAESNSRSRITVPTAGVYLIHAMISGSVVTSSSTDGVELHLRKNGSRSPSEAAYPISTYGSTAGDEYYFDYTIIQSLSANDYLEVALTNIDTSQGNISRGVFCVTLLH